MWWPPLKFDWQIVPQSQRVQLPWNFYQWFSALSVSVMLCCQDTEAVADETSDARLPTQQGDLTQGDLLKKQKLLRSTEQRRRHPATRARSNWLNVADCSRKHCCPPVVFCHLYGAVCAVCISQPRAYSLTGYRSCRLSFGIFRLCE